MFSLYDTPINGSLFILVYNAFLFTIDYIAMGIVIISIFPSLRMALSISALYGVLSFTMSGLTFPIQAMYEPVRYVTQIFPFTHYLQVFIEQSLQGAPISTSFPTLIKLNVFIPSN